MSATGIQFPTPDMVGYQGQWGWWTDNETAPITGASRQIRSPGVWTGERYYDPAYARHLSRQTFRAEQNLLSDLALQQQYAADPNPIGHGVGTVLAGTAGTILGGPGGSAAAVGAWEGLYSYALGEPVEAALEQGVIAGVVDFAGGKAFEAGSAIVGAGVRKAAAETGIALRARNRPFRQPRRSRKQRTTKRRKCVFARAANYLTA